MSEIWTAVKEKDQDGKPMIIFTVENEETGTTREEQRYKEAIPLMMMLGGYPTSMGALMQMQPLPWRFRKNGSNIYLDGPSIGVDNYHPIDKE